MRGSDTLLHTVLLTGCFGRRTHLQTNPSSQLCLRVGGTEKALNLHVACGPMRHGQLVTPDSRISPALASKDAGMSEAKLSISARRGFAFRRSMHAIPFWGEHSRPQHQDLLLHKTVGSLPYASLMCNNHITLINPPSACSQF